MEITSLAYDTTLPLDDPLLISTSLDASVRLWTPTSSQSLVAIRVGSPLYCSAFDSTSRCLYAGTADGRVLQVDIAREHTLGVGPANQRKSDVAVQRRKHTSRVASVAEVLSFDDTAVSQTGAVTEFTGHAGKVNCVAVTPEGDQIVTGGEDGTVRIWDVKSKQQLRAFLRHSGPVEAIEIIFRPPGAQQTEEAWQLAPIKPLRKYIDDAALKERVELCFGITREEEVEPALPIERYDPASPWWRAYNAGLEVSVLAAVDGVVVPADHQTSLQRQMTDSWGIPESATKSAVTAGGASTVQADDRVAQLEALVEQLRNENDRWKNVNNALMTKLKAEGGAGMKPAKRVKK